MRKAKYLLYIFLFVLIFPMGIKAENTEYTLFNSDIIVNKDRTLNVTENYKVYFIKNTKKITRKLNGTLTATRPDRSSFSIDSIVSDITSKSSKIKIGKKDKMTNIDLSVAGYEDEIGEYNLSYKYNLGKDLSSKYDELYYDIVSNIDSSISNLTFTITMPTKIDPSKVDFSIDQKYNLTKDDITLTYEDNKITGTLNKLLEKGQTFSIRIELKNGYFVGATDNFNYLNFIALIPPIIGFIIVLMFWWKYGRKNKLNVKKMDIIPNNFDSAEIGYLYKGKCEEMDLVTLLLYLANQGYLKIVENDDGYKLGKENSFRFVKLKEYEKNNAAQKLIFEHLFKDSDVAELEGIEYKFADKLKEAKSVLNNQDNRNKLYFSDIKMKKILSLILIAISVIFINFTPIHLFTNTYYLIPVISLVLMLGLYVLFISNTTILLRLIFGVGLIGACVYICISPILIQPKLLFIYILGMVLIFIMTILYTKLSNRTKYGNEVLGDCYGIKIYLETISQSTLEEKLEESPNFYYDMVPYAYVLDSFETWIQKGKGIITNPPDWYIPSEEFKIQKFEKFVKNVLYTTTMVMLKKVYSELGNIEYTNDKVKTNLND